MKIYRLFPIAAIATASLLTCALSSCIRVTKGNLAKDYGQEMTRAINLPDTFNSIETYSSTDIEYTQGPLKVTLRAPEKLMEELEVKIENGNLKVGIPGGQSGLLPASKLTVSAPWVSSFKTSGIGDILIKGINTKEIVLSSFGTGDITMENARCTRLSASSSGTGDIDINHAICVIADFNTSGIGDITVKRLVADKVSGSTTGTGDLTLSGECKEAKLNSTGTGDVNDRGLEIIKSNEE